MTAADTSSPLVEIVTPVHNGAAYIRECIESVLRQTYTNWVYTVCDNASTDETAAIVAEYVRKEPRIRLQRTDRFLGLMDNWNHALSYLDDRAAYCKVIHADDWIYPECLSEMVGLAVENPSIGLVSAFRLEERWPSLGGLPSGQTVTPGAQICRDTLLGRVGLFGSPSNILLRADLVRKLQPFYDPTYIHADHEVCFRVLEESDFGFVFKVLTFTRRHNESQTSRARVLNTHGSEALLFFQKHGPKYFAEAEFVRLMKQRLQIHYRFLGRAVFEARGKEFWRYQKSVLERLGSPLSYSFLSVSTLVELLNLVNTLRRVRGAGEDLNARPASHRGGR